MARKPLPDDRLLLEMMLKEASDYLGQIRPVLAKIRVRQQEWVRCRGNPRLLASKRPFIEQLERQIREGVVSCLGLPIRSLLPCVGWDREGWVKLLQELDRCMASLPALTLEERLLEVVRMYKPVEQFVGRIESLHDELRERIENRPSIPGPAQPAGAQPTQQQDDPSSSAGPAPEGDGEPDRTYRFRQRGDRWELNFEGESGLYSDLTGFKYIARLLGRARRQIPSLELYGNRRPEKVDRRTAQSVADGDALADYRRELSEYAAAIAKAKVEQDFTAQELLEKERAALLTQISAATKIGGRPRDLDLAPDLKAADTIRKAISNALRKIEARMPALHRHLKSTIKRDPATFVYLPPDPVPNWEL